MILYPHEAPGRVAGALRWGVAGLLVLTLHAGAGWWLFAHPFAAETPPDTVQGIQIDLEPVAVPQNAAQPSETLAAGPTTAPQSTTAPDPQPEAPSIEPATPPEKTEPPPPPDPQPQPDPPPEPKAEPTPPELPPVPPVEEPKPALAPPPDPPPVVLPEQKPVSDAVLAPPPPPPKPVRPKPDPRKLTREAAERKALADRREQRRAARAQARAAQAAETQDGGGQAFQAAAPSSASSGESVSSWRGEVMARLNAAKPASPNGASGTSRVAFSLDRGGRVLSAGIAQSSGDGTLDEAAVSMVRRASPLPAPPPELGARVSLSVPVRFR